MKELLERYFHLLDHPFAPESVRGVSPERPFNVFNASRASEAYFARLNAFAQAITDLESFFADQYRSLRSGKPPAVMILGPSGSGRNTMAAFAAHLLRAECERQKLSAPSFADVSDSSDDPARFLEEIRQVVVEHHTRHKVDCSAASTAAGAINPDAPVGTQLERFFKNLGKGTVTPDDLPLNVIAIGPIYARRERWMGEFRELLAPLRVAPIFYTSDTTVSATFTAAQEQTPSVTVQLFELEPEDAFSLLRGRFSLLKSADRDTTALDALFPYSDVVIRRLFPQRQRVNIKYILTVCTAAFDRKVSRLSRYDPTANPAPPPPDPMVTFQDIEDAIRRAPGGRP